MSTKIFEAGRTYDNVYFLFADASGYSTIVNSNPRDRAAHVFDLLRNTIVTRVTKLAAEHRCARTALWSWRGDGGFLVIHDEEESVALDVALAAGRAVLTFDLPYLREELKRSHLRGELHIRLAIHKGPIRCSLENDSGIIHSPDINFAAHLEEATPRDCLSISEDVRRISGHLADLFEPVGAHEGRNVYLMTLGGAAGTGKRAWLRKAGLAGGSRVHAYAKRPSQLEKARLVGIAADDVLDFGTALNTCVGYLLTTERPALYRDAVLDFLRSGGSYRCVLLNPAGEAATLYSALCQEDLAAKIQGSLARFRRFKELHGDHARGLHVYQTDTFPGMAALCIDLHSPDAVILYSPYLFSGQASRLGIERGDMPHYLATIESGATFAQLRDVIGSVVSPDRLTRVL